MSFFPLHTGERLYMVHPLMNILTKLSDAKYSFRSNVFLCSEHKYLDITFFCSVKI